MALVIPFNKHSLTSGVANFLGEPLTCQTLSATPAVNILLIRSSPQLCCILHFVLQFDWPDFWGTRWNVPQSQLLKALVYDPIMDGQLVKPAHDSVWQGREHGRGMANQQQKSQGHDLPSDTVHQLNRPRHPDRTEEASAHKEGDFIMRGAGAGLQGRKERSAGLAAKKFVSSSLWACMLQKRRDAARVVALLATFMFSGLEHVLFLW